MAETKLTFNTVAREICKREKSEHREVNITDVKRVMRHMLDVLEENSDPEPINICLYTQKLIVRCDATKFIWGEFSKRVQGTRRGQINSRKAREGK